MIKLDDKLEADEWGAQANGNKGNDLNGDIHDALNNSYPGRSAFDEMFAFFSEVFRDTLKIWKWSSSEFFVPSIGDSQIKFGFLHTVMTITPTAQHQWEFIRISRKNENGIPSPTDFVIEQVAQDGTILNTKDIWVDEANNLFLHIKNQCSQQDWFNLYAFEQFILGTEYFNKVDKEINR